ncbi:hypothetical protein A7C99_6557 [Trichophyton rubrum]|uniref:Uncharacterized protein n=1 Tax=Trichophyton rubrum TaxID=5551 RepID=A0A178EQB0_TRIRU|nr:hypothetical protein A7C99_6557 [Trichophyton rubrum]
MLVYRSTGLTDSVCWTSGFTILAPSALVEGKGDSLLVFLLFSLDNGSSTGPLSMLHRLSTRGGLFHRLCLLAIIVMAATAMYLGLMYQEYQFAVAGTPAPGTSTALPAMYR